MPGDTGGLKPLSNVEDMALPNPSNSDLSRFMSRAGISLANGFPLEDDEVDEEVDEDYVAVDQDDANDYPVWFRRPPTHHRTKLDELHPFVQLLSASNVEDCVEVEKAFPENERCSRDKVSLRSDLIGLKGDDWIKYPSSIQCQPKVKILLANEVSTE